MVTVGGTESAPTPPPPREPRSRASILAAIGLGAGLALGALFTGGPPQEEEVPATVVSDPDASPTTTIPTTTTTDVVDPRLATLVPGMLDVLVATGINLNGSQTVTLWEPADREPMRVPLPWGNYATDASGTWLAASTPSRWVDGSTLWVGNPAYVEPVTADLLDGPVWNAWRPGNLAWVEASEDGPMLVTAEFFAGRTATPAPIVTLEEGTELVGWFQSGLLTQTDDSLQLRGPVGSVIREVAGIQSVTGVGRELVAVIDSDGAPGAFDVDLTPLGPPAWDGDCSRVEWSPGGVAAGVLCGFGDERRFEYWADPFNESEPWFVEIGRDFVDLGFTTTGLPFVAWIDPIRPTSTILFFHPADGSVHQLDHPGRIQHLTSVGS